MMDQPHDFREFVQGQPEHGPVDDIKKMRFTPFVWRDPSEIEPRRWLFDRRLIAKNVALTVSPGGLGKSSLSIAEALAMASGKPLLGAAPPRPIRVTLWNGEDPHDELERRFSAARIHYGLSTEDLGGRLTVDSGRSLSICLAASLGNAPVVSRPQVEGIVEALKAAETDVLIIDPFVTTHQVSENDNGAINAVVSAWREIADRTGCAVEIVHHSTKLGGNRGTSEENGIAQARGASALVDGVRSARFLAPMSQEDAERAGIESPHGYFQIITGKANLAPKPENAVWRKMISVALGNGSGMYPEGDFVGVATEWRMPEEADAFTLHDLKAVQDGFAAGAWRESDQSADWGGFLVADVLHLDVGRGLKHNQRTPEQRTNRKKVIRALNAWRSSGAIVVENRPDEKRNQRKFFTVGDPVTTSELAKCPTSSKWGKSSKASEAKSKAALCLTTPLSPVRGGGGVAGRVEQVPHLEISNGEIEL